MSRKPPAPAGPGNDPIADDPFPELGDALDLWREDAARAAGRVDVDGDLADRVVAAARAGRPVLRAPIARRYAAAALVLIAVGIAGTMAARGARPVEATTAPRWAGLQETLVDMLADDPRYAPGLEGR